MDLSQLRYLLAIAQAGSPEAQPSVYMSKSTTLSLAMRRLEEAGSIAVSARCRRGLPSLDRALARIQETRP